MIKKFDEWNKLKKEIEISNEKVFPKVWEMWYINLGVNIWNESLWKWKRFKRAFLIIQKLGNMFFGVSMTTKWKNNNIFYIKTPDWYFNKDSFIIKSQLKSLDRKRFIIKIWKLREKDFYNIKKEIQTFVFWKSF